MHSRNFQLGRSLLALGLLIGAPILQARVWLLEFSADNGGSSFVDEDGNESDWIELYNDGPSSIDLSGWALSDDIMNQQKWVFPPGVSIGSQQYLVVFASNKNRRVVGQELHTNFSLKRSGEYLGLVQADGMTVEHDYAPSYPAQIEGSTYGVSQAGSQEMLVNSVNAGQSGSSAQAGVPLSQSEFDTQFTDWNNAPSSTFSGSAWGDVRLGVGYDRQTTYDGWIDSQGDIQGMMDGVNSSVFIRVPFTVENANAVNMLTLRMRWDDGFVAYLNGVKIAEDRAPETLVWDSRASGFRTDDLNDEWVDFEIDLSNVTLLDGDNVLAIQGLNENSSSSDMLVHPQLMAQTVGALGETSGYLLTPTPGRVNGLTSDSVPPIFQAVADEAARPVGGAESLPILITAKVAPGTDAVTQVRGFYRVMFGSEVTLMMKDDGTDGDLISGDGIYSASVPTTGLGAGEMIRWRYEANDSAGGLSSSPAFEDPNEADEYYGTASTNPAHGFSTLTIMETFVQNQTAVETRAGSRVSLYYLGRFYDNVQMDLHGQSTAGDPRFAKRSYDLDFNRGNRFVWKEGEIKAKDVNLLTNFGDKSKVRHSLTYEYLKRSGSAHHYAFPVRVDRNGTFYSVSDLVEDGDDRFLERIGLDPEGALYKMYDKMVDVDAQVKKTRKEEDRVDLQALFDGVNESSGLTNRRRYVYDHLDIAATINQFAAYHVGSITDTGHKNYYLYRDTNGTGEWRPIPWDVDLSFGRRWRPNVAYFNDDLITNFRSWWNPNDLWALMHGTSEFREMFLRRCDTLRDELFLSNATANSEGDWMRDYIIDLRTKIGSDGDLDDAAWSWPASTLALPVEENPNYLTMQQNTDRLINDYLPGRRSFIFSTGFNQNGVQVPADEPANPNLTIEVVEFLPASGNQDEEYIQIKNNHSTTDIDLSGWTLSGAVDFTFPAGTVLLAGNGSSGVQNLLHVARDSVSFRARASGPTGDEFRYVQGPFDGQLSARGETVTLRDENGQLVDEFSYDGLPTDGQLGLRITEINYHPIDPTPEESTALPGVADSDFEFIEFKNITEAALDLSGTAVTNGVEFTFANGISLPAGGHIILAKNPAAFAIRYPEVITPVAGPFLGQLNNDGESLRLVDGVGENILSFTYNDRWYPLSDGGGESLVLRDEATAFNGLNDAAVWGSSGTIGGSPGEGDLAPKTHFNAWQEVHFISDLWTTAGAFDQDPDGDGRDNWEEYAFATDPNVADEKVFGSTVIEIGENRYLAAQARRRIDGGDLVWNLQGSSTLNSDWGTVTEATVSRSPHGDGSETVILREASTVGSGGRQFLRMKVTFTP